MIDRHHPLSGRYLKNNILCQSCSSGSAIPSRQGPWAMPTVLPPVASSQLTLEACHHLPRRPGQWPACGRRGSGKTACRRSRRQG
ncbi:hypothetical protein [Neorhizobium sp. T6_25]|uniref:hypothetical protein n=1 Tax=Neorhizobium sp. T6_25 TaxID=2093833 RepID=UPI001FDFBC0D|nr:hypothetical protein [Neorhizobium sp. T6_25]